MMAALADMLRVGARHLAGHGIASARLDAEVLAAHVLGRDRLVLLTAPPALIDQQQRARFDALIVARAKGAPVAYLTGQREFWGFDFAVGPAVLIPRPDSETLIEAVLAAWPSARAGPSILDLGVGSGCLLLSLLKAWPQARGIGVDLSAAALAQARDNAARLGVDQRAVFRQGDWWQALQPGEGPFDVIIANPPYIDHQALAGLAPEVRAHEPRLALDGGSDGLDAYRAILGGIDGWLATPGLLAMEIGHDQKDAVMALLPPALARRARAVKDLAGHDRVILSQS
ncbi:MAG: peptide chain release factor N(5)-glutamine methyltransferase [Sphingomonadales bacterium]